MMFLHKKGLFSRLVLIALIAFTNCDGSSASDKTTYPDQFGEIAFDAALDDPGFQLCDSSQIVHSRVSLNYTGGRKRVEELCKASVNQASNEYAYNGYILVRFLVNCKGQSGRFRVETMDEGFNEQDCPEGLVALVEGAVRALDEWVVSMANNAGKDHSKYLNFKIVNGSIDAIIH